MRKLPLVLVGVLLSGLAAHPSSAASLPFRGSLAVQIATLDPIAVLGSGIATVPDGGHLESLSFAAGAFAVSAVVVPVTDPAAAPIQGVQATIESQGASFASRPEGLGGTMPIFGVAKVCVFAACDAGPPANISVPLSAIGRGGQETASFLVNVTVSGGPWTTGVASVATGLDQLTARGFAHGPASGTSSTAAPSGVVRLVTPIRITTNIAGSAIVPAFGFLTLHFVPEPATLVLLGSGVAGLALYGRSRRA